MKKSIPTADVREKIKHHIDLWLKDETEAKASAQNCASNPSLQRVIALRAHEYRSMAQALYFLGRSLGIISADDYPQFGREERQL